MCFLRYSSIQSPISYCFHQTQMLTRVRLQLFTTALTFLILFTLQLAGKAMASVEESSIEHIFVTAQRYQSDIIDTPISVEVLDGEALEKQGVKRLSEALQLLPNVYVYDDGGSYNSAINVRGIGNEIPFTEPATSVFINGVPYSGNLSDFELGYIERIEVMRGAQSTLYGQNTLAGAVNIVTRKPEAGAWEGKINAGFGDIGQQEFSAYIVGGPKNELFTFSADIGHSSDDGYLTNTATNNNEVGANQTNRFRGTVNFDLSDNVAAELSFDHNREDSAKTDAIERESYEFVRSLDPEEERVSDQAAVSINWYADDFKFVSLTGVRQLELELQDVMVQVFGSDTLNLVTTKEDELFQEFRLVSSTRDEIAWQVGLFLSDKEFELDQNFSIPAFFTTQVFQHNQQTQRSEFYGQVDWEFLTDLTLTAGGRTSRVSREVDHAYVVNDFALFQTVSSEKRDFDNTVGRLALTYSIDNDKSVFASFSQGFKPGTARSGAISAETLFLPSEDTNTIELGFKGRTEKLRYAFTVFKTDYKNRHTFYFDGLLPLTEAIPEAEARGAELSIDLLINDGWQIYAKAGYLDTEFGNYVLPGTTINIQGNEFRDTPELTASLGTSFNKGLSNGWDFFTNADITYRSSLFGNVSNIAISENPSVSLLNASVGVTKNNYRVLFSARNLLDRYYYVTTAISNGTGAPGAPRTVMLSVDYRF